MPTFYAASLLHSVGFSSIITKIASPKQLNNNSWEEGLHEFATCPRLALRTQTLRGWAWQAQMRSLLNVTFQARYSLTRTPELRKREAEEKMETGIRVIISTLLYNNPTILEQLQTSKSSFRFKKSVKTYFLRCFIV